MKSPLSRRTFLRGAGTACALPFLDAMVPSRAFASAASLASMGRAPTRLAFLYVPNGVHMPDWTPETEGRLGRLPWILEPLQPFTDDLSVLSGLAHDKSRANGDGPGDHARAAAVFLTGVQPLKTDGQVRLGISADQVAAKAIGGASRFRSLEIGCERGRQSGQCDSGYACAYSNNISWQAETTPSGKEVDPRLLFDRLFRGGDDALSAAARRERAERRKSVLDFVRADASRLRARLGADDRRKVDEYFDGVRELERRIELAMPDVVDDVPDSARPEAAPADFGEHVRLLADLLVLAFQTDSTRVATFMFANEGSNRTYRNLEIRDGHHTISHHGNDAAKIGSIRKINRFHVELLAHLLGRLSEVREGSGSLLDHTMLVYGSGIADGNRHAHHDLPILLAGRGGRLSPGRHVRYPKNTPAMNLHLALLERVGVPTESLGDSTGILTGI